MMMPWHTENMYYIVREECEGTAAKSEMENTIVEGVNAHGKSNGMCDKRVSVFSWINMYTSQTQLSKGYRMIHSVENKYCTDIPSR